MQKRKAIITLIIITILVAVVTIKIAPKANAAEETDITASFVDENLRNAILELAKEATGDESKTAIYLSDIDKIVEMTGGTSLKLANKGITNLSRNRSI